MTTKLRSCRDKLADAEGANVLLKQQLERAKRIIGDLQNNLNQMALAFAGVLCQYHDGEQQVDRALLEKLSTMRPGVATKYLEGLDIVLCQFKSDGLPAKAPEIGPITPKEIPPELRSAINAPPDGERGDEATPVDCADTWHYAADAMGARCTKCGSKEKLKAIDAPGPRRVQ